MLVLSRQPDEGLLIGTQLQIRVVQIEKDRVKIQVLRDSLEQNEWSTVESERWMHRDETLTVDPAIFVDIIDIRGDKVRLGLSAPAHLPVHRKEVFDILQGHTPFNPNYGD